MGAIDAVTAGSSPPWIDAVISIAPVELLDTKELALLAVHPDGCVTAWSPQDPSVLLMRKRPMKVSCVATVHESVQHSSLAWFGRSSDVQCYRARRREGRYIHLQLLYSLPFGDVSGVRELQTDGNSLIAVVNLESPDVLFWPAIGHVANATNIKQEAEWCVSTRVFGSQTVFSTVAYGKISSLLMTETKIWIGCTNGALLVVDRKEIERDPNPLFILRTAGTCSVTALALLLHPLRNSIVVSGLENGDIVLWSEKGATQLVEYFEHAGAISSMVYMPWSLCLCTVSTTREVFFWEWQTSPPALMLLQRAVLDDDMGPSAVRCLCPVRDAGVLACGAESSNILHWKAKNNTNEVGNAFPRVPSDDVPNRDPSMVEKVRGVQSKCSPGHGLVYTSKEAERHSIDHHHHHMNGSGLTQSAMGEYEKEHFPQCTESVVNSQVPDEEVLHASNRIAEELKAQLKAMEEERNQLYEKVQDLEKERIKRKKKASQTEVVSPSEKKSTQKEGAGMPQKFKLCGEDEDGCFLQLPHKEKKRLRTSDNTCDPAMLYPGILQSERSTQIPSRSMSPRKEEVGEAHVVVEDKKEADEIGKGGKNADEFPTINSTTSSPPYTLVQSLARHFLQNARDLSGAEGMMPRASLNISLPLNDGGSDLVQEPAENMMPICIVEALQAELSLMNVLLRNYREVSLSTDSLPMQSTNILSDAYVMMRDVLGCDVSSTIIHEALEGLPFLREREVICKLFSILCCRYRAALLQSDA